jgi:hypothetical protein
MSEHDDTPLDAANLDMEQVAYLEGTAVVFTPCCQARIFLPPDQVVTEVVHHTICPADGREWLLELVLHELVPGGLRPVWVARQDRGE